jgi:phosphopantothenoylcysteine decarboxylase/phosphopantothenate--cysteine ligase
MTTLKGKRLLLGITGGVAAYKAAALARLLVKAGADVRVAMTEAATRFVTPVTLQALTGQTAASWPAASPATCSPRCASRAAAR